MEIYYGEKLVNQKKSLGSNKKVIYERQGILVSSKSDYDEIPLKGDDRLFLWGKIYAILEDDQKYFLPKNKEGWNRKIRFIFDKEGLDGLILKIEGNFVGCLIRKNKTAVIFSDTFNRRDVFYTFLNHGVIASTELSSEMTNENKSYDQVALANLLSVYGFYAPKKHTIYKNVKRLGVGERLVLEANKGRLKKIPFSPVKTGNYSISDLHRYTELLEEAVKIRGSKACNWVYLSSGWDSTALLALLVKHFGSSNVKAVIGKFEFAKRSRNANLFEIERAKKIADFYSVKLQVVPHDFTKKDSFKQWDEVKPFLRNNHIYGDNSCNFHLLSKCVAEQASKNDMVFCGEISDGAHNLGFAQFMTILEHPVLEFREYSDKMASYLFGPTFFKSILNGSYSKDAVYKLLRSRLKGEKFDDKGNLSEYERKTKFISSFFIRNRRIPFYSLKNQLFLTGKGCKMYETEMVKTYLKECIDNIEPETLYSWILHLYNSFHWQGSMVKSITEVSRNNNLALSLPFWDKRLQQFLSAMPENWGRGLELKPTKYPLKWMLENKIKYPKYLQVGPHSYLYDVDPNFSLEAELLYGSALAPYFRRTMKNYPFEEILDEKYFNLDYYHSITDDYVAGVELSGKKLNDFYSLVWLCWVGWY